MRVEVTVGIGAWKVIKIVNLVACPHVGDLIDVDGITVKCEVVCISRKVVYVQETIRFENEQALQEYVDNGWAR